MKKEAKEEKEKKKAQRATHKLERQEKKLKDTLSQNNLLKARFEAERERREQLEKELQEIKNLLAEYQKRFGPLTDISNLPPVIQLPTDLAPPPLEDLPPPYEEA